MRGFQHKYRGKGAVTHAVSWDGMTAGVRPSWDKREPWIAACGVEVLAKAHNVYRCRSTINCMTCIAVTSRQGP